MIVTGIPYAMRADPKLNIKRQLLDEQVREHAKRSAAAATAAEGAGRGKGASAMPKPLSGSQWYTQEASRAVNQALGRVIRHINDFGAILLCVRQTRAAARVELSWNVGSHASAGATNGSTGRTPRVSSLDGSGGHLALLRRGDTRGPPCSTNPAATTTRPSVQAARQDLWCICSGL